MGKCLIFCAAEFDMLAAPIGEGDFLLAADGGLRHLQKLNQSPHGIIGDFDSLGYAPSGAEVFPVEKDDTDAMLAARKGLELGYREFVFYGSLDGRRLDHTIANFQTLQFLADHGATAYLVGKDYLVTSSSVSDHHRSCAILSAVSIMAIAPACFSVVSPWTKSE